MTQRGRKTNKKEAPKANDSKGYLDTNKDAFTDYKVIQGNKITMEGVSGQIYAIPIDSKGKAGQGRLLKAGENHEFEGASSIIEVPEVAMAKLGLNTNPTDPKNPTAMTREQLEASLVTPPYMDRPLFSTETTTQPSNVDDYQWAINSQIDPSKYPTNSIQPTTDLGTPQRAQDNALAPIKTDPIKFGATPAELLQNNATAATDELEQKYAQTEVEDGTLDPTEKIQFDNPYGGVDIPTAAQTLGASLSYDGDQKGMNTARGVASGLKLLTGLGRNVMSGYAQNKRNQWVTEEENKNQKKSIVGQTESLQQGGNINSRDLTSINDSTGIDFNLADANSLFTPTSPDVQGEQSPMDFGKYKDAGYFGSGEMQNGKRVIYNTPNNPMNQDDNRRNALDYLRELNGDTFDFQYRENSPSSSNNQVVSRQKGGKVSAAELLTGSVATGDPNAPHNVEVEGGEHTKDNRTGQVQEIVGKKHSQGGEKMNLEDHKVLSDFTKIGGGLAKKYRDEFDIKVKAKDTYATVMDKVLKKTGYKSITDELTSTIEKTEKEQEAAKDRDNKATTGINMQHLSGKINDLSNDLKPLEEMKSNVFETLFEDQQGAKPKAEIEQELTEMEDGGETGDNKNMSRERFKEFANTARRLGYKGTINPDAENLDAEAAKLQQYMVENHPKVAADYAKQNRITAKGLGQLKTNSPELFEQAGLDINKEPAQYSDEELAKLSTIAQETGAVDDEFWKDQFNDGLWRYRQPNVTATSDTNLPTSGQTPMGAEITGELMKSNFQRPNTTPEVNGAPTGKDEPEDKAKRDGTGNRTALLPDQHILPPSSMQPHRLGEITPRESEAKLISPTAQIEELNRQAMSARESINTLPDTQRRAALAQLNAQTQQSINQVMSQTNRANAQIEGQNEQANIGRAGQADIYNEQAANLHERNMLLAKDNTETDIRNYFNAQNKKQVANYNTINNMNLTNAMYDNFQYDGNGSIIQTGKGLSQEDAKARVMASYGLTEEDLEKAKKAKTKKAQRGRKTK